MAAVYLCCIYSAERIVMEEFQQLSRFIQHAVSDHRLRPMHLAVLMALCDAWIDNNLQNGYHISRRRLMSAAKINSQVTYHIAIRQLQDLGYIEYTPSYHPKDGSTITLIGVSNHITEQS